MARSRRMPPKDNDAELIQQAANGDLVKGKKSQKTFEHMKEMDAQKQSLVHNDPVFASGSETDRILIEYMRPQPENPRYLPIVEAKDEQPKSISALENCVVCEKGVFENRLSKDNPRYEDVEKEINTILQLASSLKNNDLLQPIVVWRANTTNYPIVSGHRRYYALRYLYGCRVKINTKIYPFKPKHINVLRHIENSLRVDLTAPDALKSFKAAFNEIVTDAEAQTTKVSRNAYVCEHLGMSDATRHRYEKLTEYYDIVLGLLESKILPSLASTYDNIVKAEKSDKKNAKNIATDYLDKLSKSGTYIEFLEKPIVKTIKASRGPKKKFIVFPKVASKDGNLIMKILKEDITKIDFGFDWNEVDFADPEKAEECLKIILSTLEV